MVKTVVRRASDLPPQIFGAAAWDLAAAPRAFPHIGRLFAVSTSSPSYSFYGLDQVCFSFGPVLRGVQLGSR